MRSCYRIYARLTKKSQRPQDVRQAHIPNFGEAPDFGLRRPAALPVWSISNGLEKSALMRLQTFSCAFWNLWICGPLLKKIPELYAGRQQGLKRRPTLGQLNIAP
jgi:hypothetical protein